MVKVISWGLLNDPINLTVSCNDDLVHCDCAVCQSIVVIGHGHAMQMQYLKWPRTQSTQRSPWFPIIWHRLWRLALSPQLARHQLSIHLRFLCKNTSTHLQMFVSGHM